VSSHQDNSNDVNTVQTFYQLTDQPEVLLTNQSKSDSFDSD